MSDALEMALKQAVKKIVAEAIAETMQESLSAAPRAGGAAKPAAQWRYNAPDRLQKNLVMLEKFKITLKMAGGAACALATCGFITAALFAPEFAQAAFGEIQPRHHYQSAAVAPSDPLPPGIRDGDFADLDKVEEMLKRGAILHASPDDLAAIVIFHALRKMSKGEPIKLNQMEKEFEESLPDEWLPVYAALKAEFPQQAALPLPTHWFPPADFENFK